MYVDKIFYMIIEIVLHAFYVSITLNLFTYKYSNMDYLD